MDDTDRELISLLRDDARIPVVALAKKLRVARATVQNRLARLEKDGTILGYTLRLRPNAEGPRIRALMTVAVEGNRATEVIHALRGHPNVYSLHTTNGRWTSWPSCAPTRWRRSIRCSMPYAASVVSPPPKPASCCQRTRCSWRVRQTSPCQREMKRHIRPHARRADVAGDGIETASDRNQSRGSVSKRSVALRVRKQRRARRGVFGQQLL